MYFKADSIYTILCSKLQINKTQIYKVLCKLLLDNQTPISVYSLLALDTYFSQLSYKLFLFMQSWSDGNGLKL